MPHLLRSGMIGLVSLLLTLAPSLAPAAATRVPEDPWPRSLDLGGGATATLYQPQVERWEGNRLRLRSAVGVAEPGGAPEHFGTIWAVAVTRVDRVSRLVTLDDVSVTRAALPGLPDRSTMYLDALQAQLRRLPQTIALDRLQASLAAACDVKPAGVAVQNVPPRIFVSDAPARLVTIEGTPALRPVAGTSFERVINTRALMLRDVRSYYLWLGDGWMTADALDGRWHAVERVPPGLDRLAGSLAASGQVDLHVGSDMQLASRGEPPAVFVSQQPAALVVFEGEPALQAIAGTTLLRAVNSTVPVIVDIVSGHYFVLLSGRWFRASGLQGPWTHVPARGLPRDFAAIPAEDAAGAVLASVPGTPQAKEALIESSIPQTASVPRVNGPTFAPELDGYPQYRPIAGTPLAAVANSPIPIIRVDPQRYFALKAGVWFEATSVFGRWEVAGAVPQVIYTIPPSSPLHHVTYVRIYSATPKMVEIGYTPGYTGSMVTPEGVVVHGTGYAYAPWVGTVYFPPPATYGPPRPHDSTQNVYAHWGDAVYAGARTPPRGSPRDAAASRQGQRALESSGASHAASRRVESVGAADASNDHYADVNGTVYRHTGRGWERRAGSGWEHAASEDCSWANREQQARVAGAERYQRHRASEGVDRFAQDRSGGERGGGVDAFAAGSVQVGGLRGRHGGP